MQKKLIKFVGCKILRDHKIYEDVLWVKEGKILNPKDITLEQQGNEEVREISLGGLLVAPGFIDLHIQGGFGIDLTYDLPHNPKAIKYVAKNLLSCGVTSFLPTLVSSSPNVYSKIIGLLRQKPGGIKGANILGAHVEGPFINRIKRGKHGAQFMLELSEGVETLVKTYGDMTPIKMITLAPEIERSMEVIEWCAKKDIVVGLGHSMASVYIAEEAVQKGARVVSHLFNAMQEFNHRQPGLIGLLGSPYRDKIFYTIISDGYHIHPVALKIAYQSHPEGIILTMLSNAAMGVTRKTIYHIGEKPFEVHEDIAYIARTPIMAGGVKKLTLCIRGFMEATGCSLVTALEAASLQSAKALRIEKQKGTLDFGADADFVVLNDNLDVISTWIAGRRVFITQM